MTLALFLIGAAFYVLSALVSYGKIPLGATSTVLFGLMVGALTHTLWIIVARTAQSPSAVVSRAVAWDALIFLSYGLTPVFLGVAITRMQIVGTLLVVAGITVTRW